MKKIKSLKFDGYKMMLTVEWHNPYNNDMSSTGIDNIKIKEEDIGKLYSYEWREYAEIDDYNKDSTDSIIELLKKEIPLLFKEDADDVIRNKIINSDDRYDYDEYIPYYEHITYRIESSEEVRSTLEEAYKVADIRLTEQIVGDRRRRYHDITSEIDIEFNDEHYNLDRYIYMRVNINELLCSRLDDGMPGGRYYVRFTIGGEEIYWHENNEFDKIIDFIKKKMIENDSDNINKLIITREYKNKHYLIFRQTG